MTAYARYLCGSWTLITFWSHGFKGQGQRQIFWRRHKEHKWYTNNSTMVATIYRKDHHVSLSSDSTDTAVVTTHFVYSFTTGIDTWRNMLSVVCELCSTETGDSLTMETADEAEWWSVSKLIGTAPATARKTWRQTEDIRTVQAADTVDTTTGCRGLINTTELSSHRTGWYIYNNNNNNNNNSNNNNTL